MTNDIRRRLPYYWNDYGDAWDYRVVPATGDFSFPHRGSCSRANSVVQFTYTLQSGSKPRKFASMRELNHSRGQYLASTGILLGYVSVYV